MWDRTQGVGDGEAQSGPAAVRAEAEGGALLVAALLRCMQPAAQGDSAVQARWAPASATGPSLQVLWYYFNGKCGFVYHAYARVRMRAHNIEVH